jgi:hypothetical protein
MATQACPRTPTISHLLGSRDSSASSTGSNLDLGGLEDYKHSHADVVEIDFGGRWRADRRLNGREHAQPRLNALGAAVDGGDVHLLSTPNERGPSFVSLSCSLSGNQMV